MQDDNPEPVKPEVLPPEKASATGGEVPTNLLLAQVSNYTNRPDLFLEAIEKADPGFIKRMNADAENFGKKSRKIMFTFGKRQAYTGLVVSVIAAVTLLGVLAYAVIFNDIGFFKILAIGIVFAISQAGTAGFSKIAASISNIVGKNTPPSE